MPASAAAATPGQLYLVPAPLDFGCPTTIALTECLPHGTLEVTARLQHWVCENAKSTRAYLKRVQDVLPLHQPLQSLHLQELAHHIHKKGDHTGHFEVRHLLAPALQGHDVGLISEAGMPAVADPGASVVRAAHELGIAVVPLSGPSALLLALAASGLNGQNFAFVGYLPQQPAQRSQRLRELEGAVLQTGQTQLFIETPYRNSAMLQALLQTLKPHTRLAICSGLSLPHARCHSASIQNWRQKTATLDNHTPAVFALGR